MSSREVVAPEASSTQRGVGENVLEVDDVRVVYRVRGEDAPAVDGVSLSLARGDTLALAGESGCGKTTLALACMGLLPNNARVEGSIRFRGEELIGAKPGRLRAVRWAGMSMIFQGAMNALNPVKRIGDQMIEAIRLHEKVSNTEAADRSRSMLERVGIPPTRWRDYPHEFSGGMRQRAMIAMALVCNPDVVIADEPTTALDVMVQAQILSLLDELRDEFGLALLLITHDLSVLVQVCDRAAIMYAGRVVEEGYASDLLTTPQHPYTRALVEAFPRVGDRNARKIPPGLPGDPPHPAELPPGCKFHPRCPARFEPCDEVDPALLATGEERRAACHAVHRDLGLTAS
ncbi:MAG: ABC transporter ATP-binding protein [Actinomycetota bacterium]|nr:ABC transporter ATP-binding protein [Actinomycetota bacterium]